MQNQITLFIVIINVITDILKLIINLINIYIYKWSALHKSVWFYKKKLSLLFFL